MHTYSKQMQRVHKNVIRKCPALVDRRNIVLLIWNWTPTLSKNLVGKTEAGQFYLVHHIQQTSYQESLIFLAMNGKNISLEEQMKTIVENCWVQNKINFTWDESTNALQMARGDSK